jgi:hypothetical protein
MHAAKKFKNVARKVEKHDNKFVHSKRSMGIKVETPEPTKILVS